MQVCQIAPLGRAICSEWLKACTSPSISDQLPTAIVVQVSETVRAFGQGGGSGRARMCEAAGVPLERYEQAQQRVDEKQDELNKVERIVKSCKKKAKPLVRAINGLKTRLKNCRAKIARAQPGGAIAPEPAAAAESDSDFEADDRSGSDSDGAYAPGDKRKSKRATGSRSKRRRKSLSGSDSDVGLDLFSSEDDDGSDDSDEEEEAVVPAKAAGKAPTMLPELQAQAVELQAELDEKTAIVRTLKKEERCESCHSRLLYTGSHRTCAERSVPCTPYSCFHCRAIAYVVVFLLIMLVYKSLPPTQLVQPGYEQGLIGALCVNAPLTCKHTSGLHKMLSRG